MLKVGEYLAVQFIGILLVSLKRGRVIGRDHQYSIDGMNWLILFCDF